MASAFNEPAGQGLVIFQATDDHGNAFYNPEGRLAPATAYVKHEGTAYLEYGATDWLQVMIKPDLVSTRLGGDPGGRYTGFGTSEAGLQARLLLFGPAVLAVAGTFQLPATSRESNLALIGNTSHNTDGRALLGVAFNLGPWPSYIDAEAGYRIRSGGASDEVHVDLTLGTRPRPDLLLMLQSFTTVPTGPGTYWFPASRYTNVEGSFVYDLTQRWSLQLGFFQTVDGRDALRERGIDLAVWYRF